MTSFFRSKHSNFSLQMELLTRYASYGNPGAVAAILEDYKYEFSQDNIQKLLINLVRMSPSVYKYANFHRGGEYYRVVEILLRFEKNGSRVLLDPQFETVKDFVKMSGHHEIVALIESLV